MSLLALPLLSIIFGIHEAVPVLVMMSIVTNLWIAKDHLQELRFKTIVAILLPAALGVPVGIWVLSLISAAQLKTFAGVVIAIFAIGAAMDFSFMKHAHFRKPYLFGFISGILNGSISLSGPPVIAFFAIERMPKDAFRSNLSAYFFLLNIITLGGMIFTSVCGAHEAITALALLPALILGAVLGISVSRRIDEALFRRMTLVFLLLMGLYTAFM